MNRSRRTHLLAAAALCLSLAAPARAGAGPAQGPVTRSDSTVAESWRLDNGLEVRTLHVPQAAGVSVTLAFRAGSGYDPPGREGLSELLAELQFTSAAGDVPERLREEMASLRPLGWENRPGTRLVRFTEVATASQLPGVLKQIATRLAGVQLTDAGVKAALARVRRDRSSRLFGETGDVLYWRPQLLAHGVTDEQLVLRASLAPLERLAARDLEPTLRRWYHAGNASLALAGDLSGVDVYALVTSLFAPLPGGPAMPDTVQFDVRGSKRTAPWKGLAAPVGVVAVTSPALADSLHPAFYLGMLVTGPGLTEAWGSPTPPLTSRFQYSLFDDPELVRFYPPVARDTADPDAVAETLERGLETLSGQIVEMSLLDTVRRGVRWLMGGELPLEVRRRLRADARGLGTLSDVMATRALWKGDAFWSDYLHRLDELKIGHTFFYGWVANPSHQTTLLLTPAR